LLIAERQLIMPGRSRRHAGSGWGVTIPGGSDGSELIPTYSALSSASGREEIAWGNRQATYEEIGAVAAAEKRLIYDFEIHRACGRLAT
jgi:hypothetical protein